MLFELRMLTLAAVAVIFAVIIILLRRQRLELKYCLIWLTALIGIALFCTFPSLLNRLSNLFGVETPVNMLFLICIVFLACISINLTVIVSGLSYRLRELTQNIAIMEFENSDKENTGQ